MNEKELKKLQEELGSELAIEVTSKLDEFQNTVTSKEEFADFKSELEKEFGAKSEIMAAMQSQLDQIATDLKNSVDNADEKCGIDAIVEKLPEYKGKNGSFEVKAFNTKTVGDMTRSGNLTGEIPLAQQEPGISKTPDTPTFMQDIIQTAFTTSDSIAWIERTAREGGSGNTSEAAVYTQMDTDYRRYTVDLVKITSYAKISDEMIDDVDFLRSEISSEIFGLIDRRFDTDLYSGSGSAPVMKGLTGYDSAYSKPTGLNTTDANTSDAIMAAALQVTNANYIPNIVLMNPTDFAVMRMQKDANGNYVIPPFQSTNGLTVGGLRVVTNTNVTQGSITVGDFTKAKVYMKNGITVKVWDQNDTDPIYGNKTITGVLRGVLRVSGQDAGAFVTGTIATIIAGL